MKLEPSIKSTQEDRGTEKYDPEYHHSQLKKKYYYYRNGKEPLNNVLRSLVKTLYVIRSNLAHGIKTPDGPYLFDSLRDKTILSYVVEIQRHLLEYLFDYPHFPKGDGVAMDVSKLNHLIPNNVLVIQPGENGDSKVLSKTLEGIIQH